VKLLVYSHYFAPSIGGVETIVMTLTRGLADSRSVDGSAEFELTIVTQTRRGNFDDTALPFQVERQPGLWRLWTLIRAADVVHIAGPALPPLILGLLSRKPVVIEHHGFQVICPTGQLLIESKGEPCPGHFMAGRRVECWNCAPGLTWFGARKLWLLTFARRWLCNRVAANILPTDWLGEQLKLARATTIYHGLVPIQPPRNLIAAKPEVPVLVFQGRLVSTKGASILLEAARILCEENCEFRILIIGDGPERAKLEEESKQSPLAGRVQFTGRLEAAELERVLRNATMVVVPSLGGEVFGLVVAENMQRELPVIASDLGAFVEVLGEAGITFPCGNANELARTISYLLQSPPRLEKVAILAKERAATKFAMPTCLAAHKAVYYRVVKGDAVAVAE
jgi:glycogen synthase